MSQPPISQGDIEVPVVRDDWTPPDYRCEMCGMRVRGGIDGWNRHMVVRHGPILRDFFFPPDDTDDARCTVLASDVTVVGTQLRMEDADAKR